MLWTGGNEPELTVATAQTTIRGSWIGIDGFRASRPSKAAAARPVIRNSREAVCLIPLHLQVFFQAKEISAFEGAHPALFGPLIDFQGDQHTDHHYQQ